MDAATASVLSGASAAAGNVSTGKNAAHASAREAAEEFEAVFLSSMLEGMFTGLDAEPPFGGGSTEKTYRSLLVSEYAKQISKDGGLGIADQITRDLIAIQEDAQR